jgi:hypothetical protein
MKAPDTFETLDHTAEDVYDVDGDKITQETVDDLVVEAHRVMGRPSLTGPGEHSPRLVSRIPRSLDDRLNAYVEKTGRRRSSVVREALERFLDAAAETGGRHA